MNPRTNPYRASEKSRAERDIGRLIRAIARVEELVRPGTSERDALLFLDHLTGYGARHGFSCGAFTLRLAGVTCTCTVGRTLLLLRWLDKARTRLDELQAQEGGQS